MSLRADRRAQSIQIGAVLLLAILVILFATYQAFVVPSQNREVEFNHNQRVEGDMVELRNTMLESKSTGEDGYTSVELGTSFPARLVALNPSPPSGSLRSTSLRPIVIEESGVGDITDQVCPGSDHRTRFVEYAPSYSEYREAGTIRFENTVLYHQFRDGLVRLTGQRLVDGNTIQIIPIRGNLSVGGSQTVAVEPIAGRLDSSQRDDITVTLPTTLDEAQWKTILDGEVAPSDISVSPGAQGMNLTLSLSGTRRIECGPIGLGEAPPGGPRGGTATEINPAAPGDIRLEDEGLEPGTKSEVVLRLNNTADTNNITEARINFYQSEEGGANSPTQADLRPRGGTDRATLIFRDDFQTTSPKIEVTGGTTTELTLDFYDPAGKDDPTLDPNSWFVVTFVLETGEQATYFVPIPDSEI